MEQKKVIRSTNAQINFLIDYMAKNKNFANGEFTGPIGAKKAAHEWESLRRLLKAYGPDKSIEQWKQTWRDLKRKARKQNTELTFRKVKMGSLDNVPIVSDAIIKVLDTIGNECHISVSPLDIPISRSNDASPTHKSEPSESSENLTPPHSRRSSRSQTDYDQSHSHFVTEKRPVEENHLIQSLSSRKMTQDCDEYDHFGLMIAAKIRKINDFEERESVMNSIHNLIFNSMMKTRRTKS